MKARSVFLAFALAASVATTSVAGAKQANSQGDAARGSFILEGLTLAGTQFGTPSGLPTTVPTDPLEIPLAKRDDFTYSTITCASPFPPWNSLGLHFSPDYPGITDPASVRHDLRGTATRRGRVVGTITSFLCEGGERTDQIVTSFRARFRHTSATQVPLQGGGPVPTTGGLELEGRFKVIDGTGRFEDLTGRGSLIGQFTCLESTLSRNNARSCAELGAFSEVPFQQVGHFRDPTVPAT